jgi:hypothetical protein
MPLGRGQPDVLHRSPARRVPAGRIRARRHRCLPDDPLGGQVDDQIAEPDPGEVLGGPGAPDRGPHPGQQFLDPERLGHVVIGAGVERLHLVHAVGPAGQHDDRGLGPAAQPLDHLHPVQVGQAEIEDHQVGRIPPGHLQRLDPGRRDVHLVVAHPQVDPQRPQYLRLVVDDQHSFSCSLASGAAFRHCLPSSLLRRSSVQAVPRPLWLARPRRLVRGDRARVRSRAR